MALEQASAQQDLNKSLLRIAYILQGSKHRGTPVPAIN